jgi:tetratricopeptide (TPR) repeat protein
MSLKTMVVAAILLSFLACSPADKKNAEKDYSGLLNSPPVKNTTDSIERFPDEPELRLRRAMTLSQMNEHEAATADYKKAWEITGDENVALMYASNLMLSQHLDEAMSFLQNAAHKFPENSEFNRRLAEIQVQQGNYKAAISRYDEILTTDSSNFEAWHDKGKLLLHLRDTSQAIAALERSFELMPINYSGLALANIYIANKDPRALEICDLLLSRDSSSTQTEPLFMKGVYYADTKKYDEAIKIFDECIRRDWKMTDAYIEKGIILYERKHFDEALKVFSMTATVSNTDADAYYWMGRCLEATGKKDDAIANYQRALALDQTFSEAREALRRLSS